MFLNTRYYIAFTFIFKKLYQTYKWLFEYIKNFYEYFDILNLKLILINT